MKNEIKQIYIIPNTWIILCQINTDLYYMNCEFISKLPYSKELNFDINKFSNVKVYKTKLSWCDDKIDMCISKIIEDGIKLERKLYKNE